MANSALFLVNPIPMSVSSSNNSFVTNWGDKRSATAVGVSLIFYGATPPDGYATLEVSNAPEQAGAGAGARPNNNGDDAETLPSTQQTLVLNPITGLYTVQWQISNIPAHWIRVRYTANSNKSGLTVNCYVNIPFESNY